MLAKWGWLNFEDHDLEYLVMWEKYQQEIIQQEKQIWELQASQLTGRRKPLKKCSTSQKQN